eukprot:TRINITY_DN1736_c0_g1_i52.p1 TRINITY_DN1736_c0_g1~~TRINITY_DN1736_c0_g1_i52.p1  ORF type:complete len:138 (-),score=23.46 TRINITY_DN1736_c0_g1_i52:11-424(-)
MESESDTTELAPSDQLFANGDTCRLRVTVRDDYGDGWGGNPGSWCTVEMRLGTSTWTVLNDYLRVSSTQRTSNTWEFNAVQPAEIRVNWTAGNDNYGFDDSYRVDLIVNGLPGTNPIKIGRAVQQECRDRSRMPSSA